MADSGSLATFTAVRIRLFDEDTSNTGGNASGKDENLKQQEMRCEP